MLPKEFDVTGRTVVVTGASRGIGRGIVEVLAEAGARLLVTALTDRHLGPLAKTLAKAGKHAAAARSLETYLASNPLDADANLLLGVSLESAGYYGSALAVYEFLAEIAPRNAAGLKLPALALQADVGPEPDADVVVGAALAHIPKHIAHGGSARRDDLAAESLFQNFAGEFRRLAEQG